MAEGVQLPAAKSKVVGIHETNFCIDAPKKRSRLRRWILATLGWRKKILGICKLVRLKGSLWRSSNRNQVGEGPKGDASLDRLDQRPIKPEILGASRGSLVCIFSNGGFHLLCITAHHLTFAGFSLSSRPLLLPVNECQATLGAFKRINKKTI